MLWELSTSGPRCSESGEFPLGEIHGFRENCNHRQADSNSWYIDLLAHVA